MTDRLHCIECLGILAPTDDDTCADCLADDGGPALFTQGYTEEEAPDQWEAAAHLEEIGGL